MKEQLKKWVAMIGLMAFCLLAIGGTVGAAGAAARELSPQATSGAKLGTQQDNSTSKPNDPGNSAVVDGGFLSRAGSWAKDQGVGLLYGLGVGLVVGAAVVGIAFLLAVSTPVLIVIGAAAVLAGGVYGLITGAVKFDVWDCVLFSAIAAVSAGIGTGLAGGWAAKTALEMVGGGLAMVGSYLMHDPHPTWGGAGQAFVIGAVTAGVFVGLGAAANKLFGPALGRLGGKLRSLLPWGRGAGAGAGEVGAAGRGGSSAVGEGVRPGSGSALEAEAAVGAEGAVMNRAEAGEANAGLAKAAQAGRIDYSGSFDRDLTTFFPGARLVDGALDEELVLVQYHRGDVPIGQGRSAKFWSTAEQANSCFTMNEVCQRLALPPDWGPRDTVSVARIPKGTDVTYYIGQAKDQTSDITHEFFSGGGLQLRFKNFDPAWIIETRSVR